VNITDNVLLVINIKNSKKTSPVREDGNSSLTDRAVAEKTAKTFATESAIH
jgi:hypothetical protein